MSDNEGLRVGFIGSGWTERIQIPAFCLGGLTPQAIASGHVENARRVAEEQNLPEVYESWRELVASDSVDIVSIVTPTDTHAEMAIAALQAGKHVICEKPTALNTDEAESMLAASQAAPDQLAIIDHELRFHPQRRQMRRMIKDGFVGTVLSARMTRLGASRLDPLGAWNWWSDASRGGGMLGAVGSHLLDLARWMIGRVNTMTAQLNTGVLYRDDPDSDGQRPVTVDDHAHMMLRFANGALGDITVSGITAGGYGMTVEVYGTRGALMLDNQDRLWSMQGEEMLKGEWQPVRVMIPNPGLIEQLPNKGPFGVGSLFLAQTIATSLPMGEVIIPDAASFYDGLVVQRMLDAARRGHDEQAWVRL